MERIRVVLAEMPRMLREIVETVLGAAPDVAVAARNASEGGASGGACDDADVVIVAEPSPQADAYAAALYAHPTLRVVGISTDGRDATLYELRPQRIPLGALSPESLVQVVRARHATVNASSTSSLSTLSTLSSGASDSRGAGR